MSSGGILSTVLLSGSQAAAFDLQTAFLGQPKTLAYGLVRGAGNLVFQQQMSDKSIVAFYLLGEGPWDSLVRIWLDDVATALPDAGVVQFHRGEDGEIGFGMGAVSTGGDQHVDSFFGLAGMPGTLTPITWSRYAYLALHYPPNPASPDANLTVLGDYQAMRCRIFDNAGNQTAFQWTQNPAWWICDFLIRKFILREGKVNQPLVAAELARFDWAAWSAAAAYYDALIPSGVPRFSDGGVVLLQNAMSATNALEQMLLMCQSYLLERNGKLTLYPDQPRSSVYLATIDSVVPGSFQPRKQNMQRGQNRITATWREEARASGSTDDGTRMSISTVQFDHIAHQTAIGARGPGLAVMPKVNELQLDFGIDTSERVSRLCGFLLQRQLGVDSDPNFLYVAPFEGDIICNEDSLAVEPGDVITIDGSVSEEFAGRQLEVLQVEERPDGTRKMSWLEYISGAFGDTAQPRQATQAPVPGTGLSFPFGLTGAGALIVPLDKTIDAGSRFAVSAVDGASKALIDFSQGGHTNKSLANVPDGGNRYAPITGITLPPDLPWNGGFEIFPDTATIADGWSQSDTNGSPSYSRDASAFQGNYAQKISGAATTDWGGVSSRPIAVKPGLQYALSFWAKAAANNTSGLQVYLWWFSDSSSFALGGSGYITATGLLTTTGVPSAWTQYSQTGIVAPASANFVRIVIYGNRNATTAGAVSFDTVAWALYQIVAPQAAVGSTNNPLSGVTTYGDLPEMSVTLTTFGGKVLVIFTGNIIQAAVEEGVNFILLRDGVAVGPAARISTDPNPNTGATHYGPQPQLVFVDQPAAGSHTYKIQWTADLAAVTMTGTSRTIQVVELN